MVKFRVFTIFPNLKKNYCQESILARARSKGIISIDAIDIRLFAKGPRRQVDDTPYGGGAGMIMKPEPIYRALK